MNAPDPLRLRLSAWFPLTTLAWMGAAHSAVVFVPSITVGVTETDNLTLVAEDRERETVYELSPRFTLEQEGARLNSSVDWAAEGYYYDDRSDSEIFQSFEADLQAVLDPENFFFELSAVRDQTIRDPEAPIPRSNLAISGNRLDVDEYTAGPSFRYPFGESMTASGSLVRSWTRYDEVDDVQPGSLFIEDFESSTFGFSVDNYRREQGFTWAARYSADETDYGLATTWEYRQAALEVGVWTGGGLRFFATGGKESAWDDPFDPSLEDSFWEVGLASQPGERLSLELAAGERTFGSSKRASIDFEFRRGQTALSYSEEPTSLGRDSYREIGRLFPVDLEDFLSRPGTAERFIAKRLNWNVSFDLRRMELSFGVFRESREDRTQIDGRPLEEEEQFGRSVSVRWQAGARTSFSLRANRVRRDLDANPEQDLSSLSIGADYRLGPRTDLALEATRMEEDSGGGAVAGFDYTADVVSLLFTRTFSRE